MLAPLELGVRGMLVGEGVARSRIGSEVTPRGENERGACAHLMSWEE